MVIRLVKLLLSPYDSFRTERNTDETVNLLQCLVATKDNRTSESIGTAKWMRVCW